jgi:hypothetical protein
MPVLNTNVPNCYMVSYNRDLWSLGKYYEVDDQIDGAKVKMSEHLTGILQKPPGGVPFSDVIILNHGFFKDVDAATDDFVSWINGWWSCIPQQVVPGFNPLIVATHWPSNPLMALSSDGVAAPSTQTDAQIIAAAVADPSARPALVQAMTLLLPFSRQAAADTVLPADLVAALNAAVAEAQAAGDAGAQDLTPLAATITWGGFQGWLWSFIVSMAEIVGAVAAILLGALYPIGTALFSLYAGLAQTFGKSAVLPLAQTLAKAVPTSPPRFHVMGHSLGTGVTSALLLASKAAGQGPSFGLVFLAQGAISNWCYAQAVPFANNLPGLFSPVLADPAVMSGPLLATYSARDWMVGLGYLTVAETEGWSGTGQDVAYGSNRDYCGIGSIGISGPVPVAGGGSADPIVVEPDDVGAVGTYAPGGLYNLDGTSYISGHADICGPQVAQAFWAGLQAAISK